MSRSRLRHRPQFERVSKLLGRRPQGDYDIAVARPDGSPVVLVNAPLLYSGRPMPTRYWLVDPLLNKAIGRLESTGGVREAEAAVGMDTLRRAHNAYREERDALIPPGYEGPVPTGGVGGTRQGVKCLHAHYAYFLAGGDDPVGRWVHCRLAESDDAFPFEPAGHEHSTGSTGEHSTGSAGEERP